MNLTDRALLVQLSISQWTARKYDRKATADIAAANSAKMDAGRYNKSLLPMNDALTKVHKKTTQLRQKFYANTLPWGIEGTQMLPTSNYLAFMNEYRKDKADWERLVADFLQDYDKIRGDAQVILGSLYDPDDYPSSLDVRLKFRIDMALFPVPASDFRVAIASDELSRIQQDVEQRVARAQTAAVREVWQRLYDRVRAIADKLADPKAIFRDSLVENAREICEVLPRLNFMDDPDLEAMRREVEAALIKHPDTLRSNLGVRADTAKQAQDIASRMAVFMNGI